MRINFDLASTPEYTGSANALLPAGRYVVTIVSERDDQNQSGTGRKWIPTYCVYEGEYKGQAFSENINYENANQNSELIARTQLKSLGVACGKPIYKETSDLLNIPFIVETVQEEGKDGKLRTTIKRYLPYSGQARQPQAVPAQSPPLNAVPPQQQAYAAPQYPPQPVQNYAPPQQPQPYQQPPQAAATDAPFWGN